MDKYLHSNNRTNLSTLMVTGVWIEGLYLGTQVYKATPNKDLADRIGEQKLTLDQLMLILEIYQKDKQYTKLLEDLQLLKELFKSVEIFVEKGEPQMIEIDGMLSIVQGDKSIIKISPEILDNIIKTTEQVRNRLISL
jgi:hypothetical protein